MGQRVAHHDSPFRRDEDGSRSDGHSGGGMGGGGEKARLGRREVRGEIGVYPALRLGLPLVCAAPHEV